MQGIVQKILAGFRQVGIATDDVVVIAPLPDGMADLLGSQAFQRIHHRWNPRRGRRPRRPGRTVQHNPRGGRYTVLLCLLTGVLFYIDKSFTP